MAAPWLVLAALLAPGCAAAQAAAPQKYEGVRIESLDGDAWNGVVFMAKAKGQAFNFGLRLGTMRGNLVEGPGIFDVVREVGPHAPDASYCRLSWTVPPRAAPVTLEWSRMDETTVVGRLSAGADFQNVLETYIPFAGDSWAAPITYSVVDAGQAILGERRFDQDFVSTSRFLVMVDRKTAGSGAFPSLDELRETVKHAGTLVGSTDTDPARNAAGLQFVTDQSRTAHFVAVLGWDQAGLESRARELLSPGRIDAWLKDQAEAYAQRRPASEGLFAGAAEAIGNNMFWNTLYASNVDLAFPSISRHWAHSGWSMGEWDAFFGSLLSSPEDKAQTLATIRAALSAQTETGLVPNVVSGTVSLDRSQPPVGSYALWKVLQRYPDRDFLEWAYPRLKRWHEWWFSDRGDGQPWRDGDRDGLLEWGSDRGGRESIGGRGFLQHAKWESGMDDSPMWDEVRYDTRTYTMDLDDVGLNSLYALDAESLAALAGLLGKEKDRQAFQAQYERMKGLVRERLWNESDGIYENRFWDGRFSKRLSPTNFYPLLAGIATPEQARRMVQEHLLNPAEFWGQYVVPTATRNDPGFADQYYWRGSIWGPTNYLLYHGLGRYGFDETALELARKSYALFMDDWKANGHDDELYHAWGGNGGGDPHYTWGALLCLIPLEQLFDAEPWSGLRFGALGVEAAASLARWPWQGHLYGVSIGPDATDLVRDGRRVFHADAAVVVRGYQASAQVLSLRIKSGRDLRLGTGEFASGALSASLDGKDAGKVAVQDGWATLSVPKGEHEVSLRRSP